MEASRAELEKLQKANNNLQSDITQVGVVRGCGQAVCDVRVLIFVQVRQRIENLKEEQQSLSTALTLYPPTSSSTATSSSSGVVNINDVGKLSAELHVPHISEHDAISARATVSGCGLPKG